MQNLGGAIDGSKGVSVRPLVYRTNSESMHRLSSLEMFGFLFFLMMNYRWLSRKYPADDASSAELAGLLTAYAGAKPEGEGTIRYCSGKVLTLETLGIAATVLLLLIFLLMVALSLIKSPESPLALISRSDAFESWNRVLKILRPEKAGSGMSCSERSTDGIVILERAPDLKLKITSRENQLSACTRTQSGFKINRMNSKNRERRTSPQGNMSCMESG